MGAVDSTSNGWRLVEGTPGRGKGGGSRVIYYWLAKEDHIYLLTLYAKRVKDDMTVAERTLHGAGPWRQSTMTERNIAAEVLDGLREIREYRAGKRTLKTVQVEPRPLPELTPEAIRRIRESLDVSRAVFAHMIRVPVRTVEGWEQGAVQPAGLRDRAHSHGAEIPRHIRAPASL